VLTEKDNMRKKPGLDCSFVKIVLCNSTEKCVNIIKILPILF